MEQATEQPVAEQRSAKSPAIYALTLNQENYAQEYVFGHKYKKPGDKTAAFKAAYSWENYNDNALWVKACQISQIDKVRLRIEELRQEAHQKYELSTDGQIKKLGMVSHADPRKMVNEDGSHVPIQDLGEDEAKSIQKLRIKEHLDKEGNVVAVTHSYDLAPRLHAIDMENRIAGSYEADNAQKQVVMQVRVELAQAFLEGVPAPLRPHFEQVFKEYMAKIGQVGQIPQNAPISAIGDKGD